MDRPLFPFSAVVGQERVKRALLYLAVNQRIGGVLLCGEKGTAKSTLVRALGGLKKVKMLELPLSATEDMLLGSVDLEAAVCTGRRVFRPGLLPQADGAMLYADEVNLLPSALAGSLLDSLESGVCRVERDGISQVCPARFALIGTMNPEEGTLRPQLLDRFGLYVSVTGEVNMQNRKEVVRRLLAYEADPVAFRAAWSRREQQLAQRLEEARILLPQVVLSEVEEQAACQLARQANAAGHRAELTILHTARAAAAWAGHRYINMDDLKVAAELALPHRRREGENPSPRGGRQQPENPTQQPQNSPPPRQEEGEADEHLPKSPAEDDPGGEQPSQSPQPREEDREAGERLDRGEQIYEVRPLTQGRADRTARRGSGRRNKTRSATLRGRAVGDQIPHDGKPEDLAVSATLRAAAPYQLARREDTNRRLVILPADFRVKTRESRVGADIVFAVDASGSMGASRRMKEVKEAVLSLLMDSYQKRDRVGMVVFRGKEARTALEVTRSVELAQRELQKLPTGGRTPLAAGLTQALRLLERQGRRDRESMPLLVLITDGRANFSQGGDPVEEALRAAARVAQACIPAVVIDTEGAFLHLGLSNQVAQAMGAACYRVEDLRARPLAQLVRDHSPAAG